MKHLSNLKISPKEVLRVESMGKFAIVPKDLKKKGFAFPKNFKALVLKSQNGSPKYFVFDTQSLWDMLCAADEKFEEKASPEEYWYSNPVGWLVDEIESRLPVNPKLTERLKKNLREAEKLGLVPFLTIKEKLAKH